MAQGSVVVLRREGGVGLVLELLLLREHLKREYLKRLLHVDLAWVEARGERFEGSRAIKGLRGCNAMSGCTSASTPAPASASAPGAAAATGSLSTASEKLARSQSRMAAAPPLSNFSFLSESEEL